MFVLILNDMCCPKAELGDKPVMRADNREALVVAFNSERVERYQDGRWGKSFRKGGPFEWYNPNAFNRQGPGPHIVDTGTEDDWADDAASEARERYQQTIAVLPVAWEVT